ncbi:MAG: globin [Candidatus Tectomicrobia bacterium]|nr:globin [Candidatus Tectomicrobia bacterium]
MAEDKTPQLLNMLQPLSTEPVSPEQIYSLIGEDGIARLIAAFYRQIPNDNLLAPMYPKDELSESEARLREFLVFRFGGPLRYIEQRGHPQLRMRHAPFPIDQCARDRWVMLMDRALAQVALPGNVTDALRTFFAEVATFLINRTAPSAKSGVTED